MPANVTRPFVRVLTRRRRGPRQPIVDAENALLEVAEVFRIDVVRQFFEGRRQVLQVTYVINPKDPEPGFQEDFPLELADIPVPEHPARQWAVALVKAIFEGNPIEMMNLQREYSRGPQALLQAVLREHGRLHLQVWRDTPPWEFFTFFNLNALNNGLAELQQEERDCLIMTVDQLLEDDPQLVLSLGQNIVDLPKVALVFAWTLGDRTLPYPLN